ncbi:molecular chaperone [Streptomyces sp. NPDC048604]|uniref:fimbrial biogenesis chaperone n=1 Tax=Streptomyces sp. NPDC048604 TaxID=3365578 RepID=UPI00371F3046
MAIAFDRTRVIFDGGTRSLVMDLENKSTELPYMVQAWMEDRSGKKIEGPLVVAPATQVIEAGSKGRLTILVLGSTDAQDRETLFYLNFRELPPPRRTASDSQIALRHRLELFYRPKGLAVVPEAGSGSKAAQDLQVSRSGQELTLANSSGYFVTLASLTVDGLDLGHESRRVIGPFSSATWTVQSEEGKVRWTYIDDSGERVTVGQ